MDFAMTEQQTAVAELARKIFKEARGDVWANLADAGLLGTAIPEEHGGFGHGILELCALLMEAGGAGSLEPLWPTLALGALPISMFGTSAQRQQWLPGVAGGETLLSGALEEANDVRAEANGSGWALTGEVDFVPEAHRAARVLIPARTPGGAEAVFLVDPAAAGLATSERTMTTGQSQHRIALSGTRVGPDALLGDRTNGGIVAAWRRHATVALCAMELGVCERVLRMTAKYTSQREQFDRPIATFQAVAQRAADAYIDVEAIRLSMWEAAWQLAQGREADEAVAIAKYWASFAGRRVVYAAQHLHGGIGFDLDYPLGQFFVLSKQIELTLGSAATATARLGAQLAAGD